MLASNSRKQKYFTDRLKTYCSHRAASTWSHTVLGRKGQAQTLSHLQVYALQFN